MAISGGRRKCPWPELVALRGFRVNALLSLTQEAHICSLAGPPRRCYPAEGDPFPTGSRSSAFKVTVAGVCGSVVVRSLLWESFGAIVSTHFTLGALVNIFVKVFVCFSVVRLLLALGWSRMLHRYILFAFYCIHRFLFCSACFTRR